MPATQLASENMLKQQLRTTGVLDDTLLTIVNNTPREQFVPSAFQAVAYADCVIDLGHGQVMLQPKLQAQIIQHLNIQATDSICEIGTGYGYMTALFAQLGKNVCSFEVFLDFTEQAKSNLAALDLTNIEFITDDVNKHLSANMQYDVICCTAGLPLYPEDYKQCLRVGGRLFVIIGNAPSMQALLITRTDENTWSETVLFETVVPTMINAKMPESFNF